MNYIRKGCPCKYRQEEYELTNNSSSAHMHIVLVLGECKTILSFPTLPAMKPANQIDSNLSL